jgi:sugar lactone lactonase YvrE
MLAGVCLSGLVSADAQFTVSTPQAVGTTSGPMSVTLTITTAGTLDAISVTTQGTSGPTTDFVEVNPDNGTCTTGTSYSLGDTCTVTITFSPTFPGTRYGAITLLHGSGHVVLANTYLVGTGNGPQISFSPTSITTAFEEFAGSPAGAPQVTFGPGVGRNDIFCAASFQGMVRDGNGNLFFTNTGQVSRDGTPGGCATPTMTQQNDVGVYEVMAGSGMGCANSSDTTGCPTVVQLATSTTFTKPRGLAIDGAGNLFVADSGSGGAIYEISAASNYTTATALVTGSPFSMPVGVAVDGSGNVFVADLGITTAIEKIEAVNGSIPPSPDIVALTDVSNPSAVAVDAAGDVFVVSSTNDSVQEIAVGGSVVTLGASCPGGPVNFNLTAPLGVAVDGVGNVFVSDTDANSVDELLVTPGTPYCTKTLISNGVDGPQDLTVDGTGTIFALAANENRIELVNRFNPNENFKTPTLVGTTDTNDALAPLIASNIGNTPLSFGTPAISFTQVFGSTNDFSTSSATTTVSGGAPCGSVSNMMLAQNATCPLQVLFTPAHIGADSAQLNVTDDSLNVPSDQTLQLTGTGTTLTAPNTTVGSPSAPQPVGVSFTNTSNNPITVGSISVLTQGAPNLDFTRATTGAGTCAVHAVIAANGGVLNCTVNVIFTPTVTGIRYGAIELFDNSATPVLLSTTYITGTGTGAQITYSPGVQMTVASNLGQPQGVAVDGLGNIFVINSGVGGSNTLQEIPVGGGPIQTLASPNGGYNSATGVAIDGAGNLFVADSGNSKVEELLASNGYSSVTTLASSFTFGSPDGIAVDGSGNVFVADPNASTSGLIYEIPAAGGYTSVVTLAHNYTGFDSPLGVAVDASGNVFVADSGNNAVKEITAASGYSIVDTLGGSFTFKDPTGLALDGNGNLFVADTNNSSVDELMATGGYASATSIVSLNPAGLTLDGAGNIYVSISATKTILKLDMADAPPQTFASTPVGSGDTTMPVMLNNIGNQPLSILTLGTNTPNFTLTSPGTTCSIGNNVVAAQASCNLSVEFTPTMTGSPVMGAVILTDTAIVVPGVETQLLLSGVATAAVTASGGGSTTLTQNHAATPFTPVTVTGGTAPLTFSVIPTLPAGLTLNASTGQITGTPSVSSSPAVTYTITVTDNNGAMATAMFNLTVNAIPTTATVGLGVSTSFGSTTGVTVTAMESGTAGAATGGVVTFSVIAPATGSFSPTTCTLSAAGTCTTTYTPTGTLAAGTYTNDIMASFAAAGNYAAASATGTLSVTQTSTTTTLTASNTAINPNQTVTLTAQVNPGTSGTPTGSVMFFDNGTVLQTVSLIGAAASYAPQLSPGTAHTITATYSGDMNYLTSTSTGTGSVIVTVAPLGFSFTSTSASGNTQTVLPGKAATFTFFVSPTFTNYAGTVTFTVTGLPTGATATFTPDSIPVNGGVQGVTMIVQTPSPMAHNSLPIDPLGRGTVPVVLALTLLPFAGSRKLQRKLGTHLLTLLWVAGCLGAASTLTGCGAGVGFFLQPPQTYTLTVTATSGSQTQTNTVTLTVH